MNESAVILNSFEEHPDSWRNVARSVVDALKSSMRTNINTGQMIETLQRRLDALENKVLDAVSAIDVMKHNYSRVDNRVETLHEQLNRGLAQVATQTHAFRDTLAEDAHNTHVEQHSLVTKLITHIRGLEAKLTSSIDVEDELMNLAKEKVDVHAFQQAMDRLRSRIEHLSLPRPCLPTAAGEATVACGGPISVGRGFAPSSRWLWEGGSFTAMGRAIPWSQQVSTCGRVVEWHPQAPHTIKILRGGIYRVSIGVFNDAADTSVPSVGVYIDNDAVINATNCSTYMLKATKKGRSARAARTACGCLPQCVNGLTVSDSFFIPQDAIVAIAYRADPRNVVQAFLEIEPFV